MFALMALIVVQFSFGQTQIENGNFDGVWEDVSGSEDEPIEWSSLKTGTPGWIAAFAPIVAFKETTDPHSAPTCVRLEVINSSGVNATGIITNGRVGVDTNPDNGDVHTNAGTPGQELVFNDRPDSLVFWVKHQPVGGDKSKIEVILHDNSANGVLPETGSTAHWVGRARIDVTATHNSWTRYATAFNYYNSSTPDYLLCVIAGGDSTIAVEGTQFWVDDVELIYNPIVCQIDPAATQNIDVGVNGTMLTVTEQANAATTQPTAREWKFSTTAGGPYSSFSPTETGTTYTPNFAAAGIYYVVCESDFGSQMVTSNEVEIVVTDPNSNTVTITPSAMQTILTDEDGNLLTATETPSAASSREWMVSNSTGGPYSSFSPAETGTTYTPNFSALGTYYVVCESDFAGDVQISNEVIIDVPSSAGIDTDDVQFKIFNENGSIKLVFESSADDAHLSFYSLDGKKVYQKQITQAISLHDLNQPSGIYVYRLVYGNRIITGKIQH